MPPKTKLAGEGIFNCRRNLDFKTTSKFRYQYVIIENLSSDYFSCLQHIDRAIYLHEKDQATVLLREKYKITGAPKPVGTSGFASYYSSADNSDYQTNQLINIAIEVDLDMLLSNEASYVPNYNLLSADLVTTLSRLENVLSPSISGDIKEKVFETVPIPQNASLSRYSVSIDDSRSVVLLNQKIILKVDNVMFFYDPNGQKEFDGFNYFLSGQTTFSFYRDQNGKLKQSAFLKLDENRTPNFLPNNSIVSPTDKLNHIQSSSVDIQLSSITKKKFYGLYQNFLKRNNDKSSKGVRVDNIDDNLYRGGSILLFSDDPNDIISFPRGNTANTVQSTFCNGKLIYNSLTQNPGCRTVITPMIPLFLSETPQFAILGSTTGQWLQMQAVPKKNLRLFRIYNGVLKKVKGWNDNTFLLPGDKISTK